MGIILGIKIEKTGRGYSIASSEYLVTFPNGETTTIWSPPWNDFINDEEDEKAMEYATKLWNERVDNSCNI